MSYNQNFCLEPGISSYARDFGGQNRLLDSKLRLRENSELLRHADFGARGCSLRRQALFRVKGGRRWLTRVNQSCISNISTDLIETCGISDGKHYLYTDISRVPQDERQKWNRYVWVNNDREIDFQNVPPALGRSLVIQKRHNFKCLDLWG